MPRREGPEGPKSRIERFPGEMVLLQNLQQAASTANDFIVRHVGKDEVQRAAFLALSGRADEAVDACKRILDMLDRGSAPSDLDSATKIAQAIYKDLIAALDVARKLVGEA
ncbi:hypothetical protein COU18_00820 [Candidatus Kaiserbacteria bacterium CG10_big_fil_rev_8_21_14_0_10_51_14]|uniref:Uncharacterized protein n=1 Tax=Candidatus Kaiserbacteria bacterium CG10_big_fil_rev_8_21_14_0_10_51_14 TaxID=1974610 RepID=A0A2H0UC12_9BACT|nr:MAG: hypothetical protein COU18_00820 [Candidatus Kaiserbacteria bacterium CG10_big_fil_rev_8_21_14_0_10_51_14]